MKKIEDGGPAFPGGDGEYAGNPQYYTPGMTLRDWLAGQALPAIIADCTSGDGFLSADEFGSEDRGAENQYETVASDAYAMADAMLRARAKLPKPSQISSQTETQVP